MAITYNNVPTTGNWGNSADVTNDNFLKTGAELTRLDAATSSLSIGLTFRESVGTFDDLATTYPTAEKGWASLVEDEGFIYQFDGAEWNNTGLTAFPSDIATLEDLENKADKINEAGYPVIYGDSDKLLQSIQHRYLFALTTPDFKQLLTFDRNAIPFIANIDKALRNKVSSESFTPELATNLKAAMQMEVANSRFRSVVTDSNHKVFTGVNLSATPIIRNKPFESPYSVNIDANSREVVLTQTLAHENRALNFFNVLKISENLWYMWYSAIDLTAINDFQSSLCFAYSENGKDWTKGIPNQPERSNIIVSGVNDQAWLEHVTFIEPSDTEYPYRILYSKYKADADGEQALYMSKSANGWDWIDHKLIINKKFDTQYSIDILPNGNYLIFLRLWDDPIHTDRQTGVVLLDKQGNVLLSPHLILTGNLYTSAAHRITGNDYLLFPTLYNNSNDTMNISMSYYLNEKGTHTFDNINYKLLPVGMDKWAVVAPKLIPSGTPSEYWMYYYGRNTLHNDTAASITNYYRIKVTIKRK